MDTDISQVSHVDMVGALELPGQSSSRTARDMHTKQSTQFPTSPDTYAETL